MGLNKHLGYLLEARQKKGWPDGGLYSIWSGDENKGYYLGYEVHNDSPKRMITNITKAEAKWRAFFKDTPKVIQEVLYY